MFSLALSTKVSDNGAIESTAKTSGWLFCRFLEWFFLLESSFSLLLTLLEFFSELKKIVLMQKESLNNFQNHAEVTNFKEDYFRARSGFENGKENIVNHYYSDQDTYILVDAVSTVCSEMITNYPEGQP